MIEAGIHPGDLIAVDRAVLPRDGHVVVAVLDGEHTLKRFRQQGKQVCLEAANERYSPLELQDGMQLVVWGVVTHVIHALADGPPAKPQAGWARRG